MKKYTVKVTPQKVIHETDNLAEALHVVGKLFRQKGQGADVYLLGGRLGRWR